MYDLAPVKRPRYPLYRGLDGHQRLEEKSFAFAEERNSFGPLSSPYTDTILTELPGSRFAK
jgi:hypothetical protein